MVSQGCSKQYNERPSLEEFKSALNAQLARAEKGTCPECINLDNECHNCFIAAKYSKLVRSLTTLNQNQPLKLFNLAVDKAEQKASANNGEGKEVATKLKELALEYSMVKDKAQILAKAIQSYGEKCQKVADDYLEDGNVAKLFEKLGDAEVTKSSLLHLTTETTR